MCKNCSIFGLERDEKVDSACKCPCPSSSILKMNFWGNICKECHDNLNEVSLSNFEKCSTTNALTETIPGRTIVVSKSRL